jgi:hypothetical protein
MDRVISGGGAMAAIYNLQFTIFNLQSRVMKVLQIENCKLQNAN